MLSKRKRVAKGFFSKFKRPEKTFSSNHLTARIFTGMALKEPKFSVSVSKKIEKRAVWRNKMRRMAYDTIRENESMVSGPFFIHFIFKSKPADLKTQIPAEVKSLLQKI